MRRSRIDAASPVRFRDAVRTWLRIGLLSFGGPAGQISIMHRILVEEKRWISESRFLHALNYCMLLPGPEAQQLATYVGWLLHRVRGGLAAGILFILPGFVAILALSVVYARFQQTTFVQSLFYGMKPAVVAIVLHAVVRISGRTLRNPTLVAIAGSAFVAIFFFEIPFPAIVVGAGLIGFFASRIRPGFFPAPAHPSVPEEGSHDAGPLSQLRVRPSLRSSTGTAAICLLLWWAPIALLALLSGTGTIWIQEALFFSKTAVVTFGGAYAVLAYIAQQAVEAYGWLEPGEMLDGLSMAETTPGPLIMVVQFVGFMGAYRHSGAMDPLVAGVLGSVLTTWVTFVPCFLFVFLGAPWFEHLRGYEQLSAALSGITAAVVGVILNLTVWFALHVLFLDISEARVAGARLLVPDWTTLDVAALLIATASFVALFALRWGVLRTLMLAGAAGLLYGAVR